MIRVIELLEEFGNDLGMLPRRSTYHLRYQCGNHHKPTSFKGVLFYQDVFDLLQTTHIKKTRACGFSLCSLQPRLFKLSWFKETVIVAGEHFLGALGQAVH